MEVIKSVEGDKELVAVESLQGGREENQDSFVAYRNGFGLFVVVCDGMGGGPSGALASSTATKVMYETFKEAKLGDSPQELLKNAITLANARVYDMALNDRELRGMGTTCVCIIVKGINAYVAHIGDSRLYHLRKGKILKRTADHSYVAEMVRNGTFTEEQARNSNYSNVLTQAIGIKPEVKIEYDFIKLSPGDRIAMMSDGIWNMLPEKILVKNLTSGSKISECVDNVTEMVDTLGRDNGNQHDNLTLALIAPDLRKRNVRSNVELDIPEENSIENKAKQDHRNSGKKKKYWKWLIVLLGVILLFGGLWWFCYVPEDSMSPPGKTEPEEKYIEVIKKDKIATQDSEELLMVAVKQLKELQRYKQGSGYDTRNRMERIYERRKLVNGIISTLDQASSSTSDVDKQEKIKKLIEKIKESPVIATGIDRNHGLTTADASKIIDQIVSEIEKL